MDNSSRNIVLFIGTITFSAMLLMAAHFYADWQEAKITPAVETAKVENPEIVETANPEQTPLAKEEEEEEFPEDEDFPLIGEPMVNVDGEDAVTSAPAPLPSPQPTDAVPPDPVGEGYVANN
jgi:hypothetical protein